MKIIQLNSWLGRLNGPLKEFVVSEQPDILCMQEAFAPHTKYMKVFRDQYGFIDQIIEAGSFGYNFFAAAWGFEIGGTVIKIGNIILSKLPLSEKQAHHTNGEYHIRDAKHDDLNTRVWQACTVTLANGQAVSIANYQGYVAGTNNMGDERCISTMKIASDKLQDLKKPLIFCGDLNVVPASPALKSLSRLDLLNLTEENNVTTTLSSVHRAPLSDRESVACDYIFVSKDIKIKNFKVSEEIVSDHKPLILEFAI